LLSSFALILGNEGYSVIAASGKGELSACAMRVAARQGTGGILLITR